MDMAVSEPLPQRSTAFLLQLALGPLSRICNCLDKGGEGGGGGGQELDCWVPPMESNACARATGLQVHK